LAPPDCWLFPKIEGDLKSSTFFIRCQSWGSCAQMDQQPTRNFLHERNEQMDRIIKKMCSHKWWLFWKISVHCVREINFLHSDIIVIILHCQKLILYNWRHYLSITPRTMCSACTGPGNKTTGAWRFALNTSSLEVKKERSYASISS